jgi:hypothetical protein
MNISNHNPTIVTMFYDIREKETNNVSSIKKFNTYFELAKQFILKLPYNLIVFTDDDNCIELVSNERKLLQNKTYICKKKLEDTYYFKHFNKLLELQQKYSIINGNMEKDTPMYIILTNNKFDFMETSIRLNPFNSSHFIWMDFGVNHVALNTEKIHDWIHKIPDKIKQLCINPYIENVEDIYMFQYIYHHTAGGLFSGSKDNLLRYSELFQKKTQQIYDENWYQLDEAVMTIVQKENPDLFDFFYGDYQGIISNYLYPIHNIDLILTCSQKYIDYNKTKEAYDILCYCNKYFERNLKNELIYVFLQQHIIVDYYNNNKLLIEQVVCLINLLKQIDKDRIMGLLNCNKTNIDFYDNKNTIIDN